MYLLFFSKKCKYSLKFIEMLRQIKEIDFFNCVEVIKSNGRYPDLVQKYKIKEVPSIIINGELMVGPVAFRWLKSKIKNVTHSISSQDTRANKTPIVSGYSSPAYDQYLTNGSMNSTLYSSVNSNHKIYTPEEGTQIEKSSFTLAPDNITNGLIQEDSREDKNSRLDRDYQKLLEERGV